MGRALPGERAGRQTRPVWVKRHLGFAAAAAARTRASCQGAAANVPPRPTSPQRAEGLPTEQAHCGQPQRRQQPGLPIRPAVPTRAAAGRARDDRRATGLAISLCCLRQLTAGCGCASNPLLPIRHFCSCLMAQQDLLLAPTPLATHGGAPTVSAWGRRPTGVQGAAAGSGWWGTVTTSAAHSWWTECWPPAAAPTCTRTAAYGEGVRQARGVAARRQACSLLEHSCAVREAACTLQPPLLPHWPLRRC